MRLWLADSEEIPLFKTRQLPDGCLAVARKTRKISGNRRRGAPALASGRSVPDVPLPLGEEQPDKKSDFGKDCSGDVEADLEGARPGGHRSPDCDSEAQAQCADSENGPDGIVDRIVHESPCAIMSRIDIAISRDARCDRRRTCRSDRASQIERQCASTAVAADRGVDIPHAA